MRILRVLAGKQRLLSELRIGQRDASLEDEVLSHVPERGDLDALLLRIVPIEDAPYPEGRFARTVAVYLEIRPFHEERRDIELHRSEEHTSELQSQSNLVCRLLLEKKKKKKHCTFEKSHDSNRNI